MEILQSGILLRLKKISKYFTSLCKCFGSRGLLDMREHCLNEFDFHDPYWKQKRVENDAALQLLPGFFFFRAFVNISINSTYFSHILDRLEYLDSLERDDFQIQLAIGILAGNVFDWGAKEVALLMEGGNLVIFYLNFYLQKNQYSKFNLICLKDFNDALKLVGPRPWLVDDFDRWVERLDNKNVPHK